VVIALPGVPFVSLTPPRLPIFSPAGAVFVSVLVLNLVQYRD